MRPADNDSSQMFNHSGERCLNVPFVLAVYSGDGGGFVVVP